MELRRSWLVLADGFLTSRNAKTAHGVLRYSPDRIAAVLDRDNANRSLASVMPELNRDAPIVGSVEEGLVYDPTSLLLGVATAGGWIPDHWRGWTVQAIEAGLEIANGLHRFLRDDPELVALAAQHDARLWDVREPPPDIPLFSGTNLDDQRPVVLTVGSDCAVGKMTVALELAAEAKAAGTRAEFIATGQTGILIAGWGIAVDRVIADFVSGAAEKLVSDSDPSSEVLVVEGQGSLWHPAYAGVTLGLLHGSAPHVLVLCHQAGRMAIEEPPYTPLPALSRMIEDYEATASTVRPAKVACIALNSKGLEEGARQDEAKRIGDVTGLPVADPFNDGASALWGAVEEHLPQSR